MDMSVDMSRGYFFVQKPRKKHWHWDSMVGSGISQMGGLNFWSAVHPCRSNKCWYGCIKDHRKLWSVQCSRKQFPIAVSRGSVFYAECVQHLAELIRKRLGEFCPAQRQGSHFQGPMWLRYQYALCIQQLHRQGSGEKVPVGAGCLSVRHRRI